MKLSGIGYSVLLSAALLATPAVMAGAPNFGQAIYGDEEIWGTKGTTALPAPNAHNMRSFDKLFMITNSNNPAGQLPVSEAAPGNPDYNGGRWWAQTVEWTEAGFLAHPGYVPVLTSYEQIMDAYNQGYLTITPGADYFQCPLLPVK